MRLQCRAAAEDAESRTLLDAFSAAHAQTIAQLDPIDLALDAAPSHFAAKTSR